jgi:hypothetical protein
MHLCVQLSSPETSLSASPEVSPREAPPVSSRTTVPAKPLKKGEPAAAAAATSEAAAPKRSLSGGKGATPAPARAKEVTRVSLAPSKPATSKHATQDEPKSSRSKCVSPLCSLLPTWPLGMG